MYSRDELKQLKKDFWGRFGEYTALALPGKKKFMLYNTKLKGTELKFDATRDGAYVILEINHKVREERERLYNHFVQYRVLMEASFPDGLVWAPEYERESGQQVSRIYTYKSGIDIHRQHQWEEFYDFMLSEMLKLEDAFIDVKDALG